MYDGSINKESLQGIKTDSQVIEASGMGRSINKESLQGIKT